MNDEMKRIIDLLNEAGYFVKSIGKPLKDSLFREHPCSFALEITKDDSLKEESRSTGVRSE
jgi:hypothetical protein